MSAHPQSREDQAPEAWASTPEATGDRAQHSGPTPESGPPTREQMVAHGIVGDRLERVMRRVPLDEPPPLAENADLAVIGKSVPRLDGYQKVTGQARYTFDVQLPGMLYARRVVSTLPHARIISIDTSKAEHAPGVRAVHVLDRQLLEAQLRNPADEPEHRYPIVRYAGQPLAGVAAETQRAADDAARLVEVTYEPLPHVTALDDAMRDEAPVVFPGPTEQAATAGGGAAAPGLPQRGNVRGPDTGAMFGLPRGDVGRGLADADVVVEAEYRTQVQTHVPMETHGIVADWREDGLTIYASTQFTTSVRDEAAELFNLPKSRVRVISDFTGGGFGAKYGIGNFGLLAVHLSQKAGAPVRLMLDRREEHISVGNRPSSLQRLKIGAKRDGTLTAIQLESYGSGGVAAGAGVGFAHALLYPCPNVSAQQFDVFTNAGPCAAFRAPGQVQGIFGLEQSVDELADRLGIDPIALRDTIDTGGTDDAHARRVERRIGADKFGWRFRRPPNSDASPVKRGVGMAQSQWVSVIDPPTSCEVRIMGDGSVEAFTAAQDIGTGTRTVLAQVVAEELGLQVEDVGAYIGDTRYPVGPPSGGSRVTGSLTPAARNAAYRAARDLAARLAPVIGVSADSIVFADRHVGVRGSSSTWLTFNEAVKKAAIVETSHRAQRRADYDGYMLVTPNFAVGRQGIGGVQFADVSVDTETGSVKVQRIVAVHDCGRPINPKLTESQILGGIIQGIGFALYEERHLDHASGVHLNANVDQYKMSGSREVPEIEVHIIEQFCGQSSTDARGVAEPANVATAAAIANAFFNATGTRVRTLPMTPANVLKALGRDNAQF
jgi:xanthine dehydrogenase YagR molybdenum-binding subunit